MRAATMLHVGIAELAPLRVAHKLCLFHTNSHRYPDPQIRKAFQEVREWVVGFGLDADVLLHVGVPLLDERDLVTYDCCVEFPLPVEEERGNIGCQILPGGRYAILRVEKKPGKIVQAIRQFRGD